MTERRTKCHALLTREADTYVETMRGLRALKDIAHPQALSLDENPEWQSAVKERIKTISSEKRAIYLATMTEALPFVMAVVSGNTASYKSFDDADDLVEWQAEDPWELLPDALRKEALKIREVARSDKEVLPDLKMFVHGEGSRRQIRFQIEDPEIAFHFWTVMHAVERSTLAPSHSALLMRSILTMAVSAFEVLVGNLYRAHLLGSPQAMDDADGQTFTLKDLFDFGSVEDAVDESIFRRADAFSRRGVKAWAAWFAGKPLGIEMSELALGWVETQEIFERRNVVVHNGSRVTRQYLNNVDRAITSVLSEGESLEISSEYLDQALERLLALGVLLSFRVRHKIFRRDDFEETSSWISAQQFTFLTDEHFGAAKQVATSACELDLVQINHLMMRVNGWIARMRLEGVDCCRREIETWDTSALSANFRAAQQVLLRNDELALRLIRECLESHEFTIQNLAEWPLFHWLREDGALDLLIEERSGMFSGEPRSRSSLPSADDFARESSREFEEGAREASGGGAEQ